MGDKAKHLLVISPGFAVDENDENCLPAIQQFLHCFQRVYPNIKITLIALHYPFNSYHYNWYGIEVYCIGGKNRKGLFKLLTIIKGISRAISENRKVRFDAVLSLWLMDTAVVGKFIAKIMSIPFLVWLQGQDAKKRNRYFKRINPKENEVAVISAYQQNILSEAYKFKAGHIINNGINETLFPELNTGKRAVDLLAVGSLSALKQPQLFIELIAQLVQEGYTNIKGALVGKGELGEELKLLVDKLGLQDNVQLTGELKHSEVLKMMNNARIFIHTSNYEGQSTVMLEALYSGCKVISFLPAGDTTPDNFYIAMNIAEMKNLCLQVLKDNSSTKRVLYNNMEASTIQVARILKLN